MQSKHEILDEVGVAEVEERLSMNDFSVEETGCCTIISDEMVLLS